MRHAARQRSPLLPWPWRGAAGAWGGRVWCGCARRERGRGWRCSWKLCGTTRTSCSVGKPDGECVHVSSSRWRPPSWRAVPSAIRPAHCQSVLAPQAASIYNSGAPHLRCALGLRLATTLTCSGAGGHSLQDAGAIWRSDYSGHQPWRQLQRRRRRHPPPLPLPPAAAPRLLPAAAAQQAAPDGPGRKAR